MVKFDEHILDGVFAALSDSTRRRVLADLEQGAVSVSELARPHAMSLPAFMKHLRVLENAGLIARNKDGRVVSCSLSAAPMRTASEWLAQYEKFWTGRLDALARYLYHEEETKPWLAETRPDSNSDSIDTSTPVRKESGVRGPTRKR